MRWPTDAASASTWWTPIPRQPSTRTQLRVGRLVKAHGLKGALKIELFTDEPERRFVPGASFTLQVSTASKWHGKTLELSEMRVYNGTPVGFFVGVGDRSEAETLIKAVLWVDQDAAELPAEPNAWYYHQITGLDVVRDGAVIGRVARVDAMPAQDLLVVQMGDREVLVPFVSSIVPEVDVAAGRITITPPAGLIEDLPDDEPDAAPAADAESADAAPAADEPAADAGPTAGE